MHKSSFERMRNFRDAYLANLTTTQLRILDLGAQDVNGCFRSLFDQPNWQYQGMDMCPGANVDIVLENPYDWKEVATGSADIIISGSTFEHIEYFWITMQEVSRALRPGGLACIIAPSSGPEHRYPVDCWRFYPDGLLAMARYAGLEVLKAHTDWNPEQHGDGSEEWKDSILICRKPATADQSPLTARHPFLNIRPAQNGQKNVRLVCVSHKPEILARFLLDNPHLHDCEIAHYDNRLENAGIAERYNHFIDYHLSEAPDSWIVFLHHDFRFEEDPGPVFDRLDPENIYGPIGAFLVPLPSQYTLSINRRTWWKPRPRLRWLKRYQVYAAGEIGCNSIHENRKGSGKCGIPISEPTLVDTLDCCCLIVHSSLIRKHSLRFDALFARHLYSEDFSLVAKRKANIKTFATNIKGSHISDTTHLDQSFYEHLKLLLTKHPAKNFASTCYGPVFSREEEEIPGPHFRIPGRIQRLFKIKREI